MKRQGILNPMLASVVASLGHGDLLGVADAGLPIAPQVQRIDLALVRGVPSWSEVLEAIASELVVEGYVLAEEARTACPDFVAALVRIFADAEVTWVSHAELKTRAADARAMVRSGSVTPYTNVLLRSGVDFA